MTEIDGPITRLLATNALREPLLREVVAALGLPPGSAGLDAGCGPGLQALLLADAVGSEGQGRVTLREGDVNRLPFADASFDRAWSADCVGYPARNLPALVSELARVIRPAGKMFLLAWSSQQLPGHPFLEAQWSLRHGLACSAAGIRVRYNAGRSEG